MLAALDAKSGGAVRGVRGDMVGVLAGLGPVPLVVVAYNTFASGKDGSWKPGVLALGLKEDGVGYALDDNNKSLVTPPIKTAADAAIAEIAEFSPQRIPKPAAAPKGIKRLDQR